MKVLSAATLACVACVSQAQAAHVAIFDGIAAAVGGNLGEARVLLFAALLLADEADELRTSDVPDQSLDHLEKLADRLSTIGDQLATGDQAS